MWHMTSIGVVCSLTDVSQSSQSNRLFPHQIFLYVSGRRIVINNKNEVHFIQVSYFQGPYLVFWISGMT